MKVKANLLWCVGLLSTIFCLLFIFYGYNNTWMLWNVPTLSPHFADLRAITAGAESYAKGYEPMISNPCDPWNRSLNYPRVWQCLYSIGVNQTHTTYIGIGLICVFLVGICLLWSRINNTTLVFIIAAIVSPAVLLGIERANIDLLMFFLLAGSVMAVKKNHIMSTALILFGFILKLYPVFGIVVLLRKDRSIFIASSVICIVVAFVYTFFNFDDLVIISKATPRSTSLSYGVNVIWMKVMSNHPTAGVFAKILSYGAVLSLLFYAFLSMLRDDLPTEDEEAPYIDSFRVGSAIYLGTFLLGNNWDYRLMFLIFTIPQLLWWANCTSRAFSRTSKSTLACLYVSMWYLMIARVFNYFISDSNVSFLLDEFSNWWVFAGLLFLLFLSMPKWVKKCAQCAMESASITKRFT